MVAGEFDGVRWKVSWSYEDDPITFCSLRLIHADGTQEGWSDYTTKHPSDPPNREIARRVSLERLLRGGELEAEPDFGFGDRNREFRRAVWNAYWGRKKNV